MYSKLLLNVVTILANLQADMTADGITSASQLTSAINTIKAVSEGL